MMKKEPLPFHIMLKHGTTWFTLASNTQETVYNNIDTFPDGLCSNASIQLPLWILLMPVARRHCGHGDDSQDNERNPHI